MLSFAIFLLVLGILGLLFATPYARLTRQFNPMYLNPMYRDKPLTWMVTLVRVLHGGFALLGLVLLVVALIAHDRT